MLLITSHFILWLLQTSCSIFIDVACYNHSRVFYACCTISMHITVILVVMLKSAILLPKNSMCPILPLNKNYLRNYLEPKNYLEVPEWQDDSWSGNCRCTTKLRLYVLVPGTQSTLYSSTGICTSRALSKGLVNYQCSTQLRLYVWP